MPIDVSPNMSASTRRRRMPSATRRARFAPSVEIAAWLDSWSSGYAMRPVEHHSSRRSMNAPSEVQSAALVHARDTPRRPTLSRQAAVLSSPTSPGHWPEKFEASSSGLSLPTTPSVVCGP